LSLCRPLGVGIAAAQIPPRNDPERAPVCGAAHLSPWLSIIGLMPTATAAAADEMVAAVAMTMCVPTD